MRCLSKSFKLVLGGILFLSLLAGCSGGGGGGSSETSTVSKGVQSYEGYTDSSGIASFTLNDGSVNTVNVTDSDTSEPIAGIKVMLTTYGTEALYYVMDENNLYASTMQSYQIGSGQGKFSVNATFETYNSTPPFALEKLSDFKLFEAPTIQEISRRLIDPDLLQYF